MTSFSMVNFCLKHELNKKKNPRYYFSDGQYACLHSSHRKTATIITVYFMYCVIQLIALEIYNSFKGIQTKRPDKYL